MYSSCMIVNIPLASGNKLNCFISAREMLSIPVLMCCCFVLFFFTDFLHVNKSFSQTKKEENIYLFFLLNLMNRKGTCSNTALPPL